ncbi:phosphopantothenoylcysteine decarboxylase [Metasolibacillus meyeri]|uniref:Phosphopantothenoylcysteine decarboxylase n=1 Tax=Metasolibacillus meyeri TaxID=1071052 RepID=A0AAW9NTG2_9BACL|nr:phosphopantothenoylcysteine decarboxylase [Metasolibacillus meyeri]MEC1177488.1 phosphopantothenoylcysteine decarboxylase [Metasolibacillus meyeri]
MLQGKKIIITSGGTLEKWDQVRGHTNLSKGIMGCYLAEAALDLGAEVIYMHGYFAKLPDRIAQMRKIGFEGIEDLSEKLQTLLQEELIDIVIMAVAGSDWVVDQVFDQAGNALEAGGKMSSDEPPTIRFKKAPKILPQIKGWAPNVTLVGFKLEATTDPNYLIERAKLRMQTSKAQYTVANSSASLYGNDALHLIVRHDGQVTEANGKKQASEKLMALLAGGEANGE